MSWGWPEVHQRHRAIGSEKATVLGGVVGDENSKKEGFMKCLDDCHNYEMDTFLNAAEGDHLQFYRMALDGSKTDGVTNEEVLRVLIHRLTFLNEKWQNGKFRCRENSLAITKLEEALMWLEKRTADRVARKVEATQNV
jgi:hypothetical protein